MKKKKKTNKDFNKDNESYNERYGVYEEKKLRTAWFKISLSLLIVSLLVVTSFIVIKLSSKKNVEKILLESGKAYFKKEGLPENAGECIKITIDELYNKEFINDKSLVKSCSKNDTYLKVCKLPNNTYHYTPIYKCGDMKTKFTDFKTGNEENLIKDKSDVEFVFKGQISKIGIKYFYPSNKNLAEENQEYYTEAPNTEYIYKESDSVEGFKYYKETDGKVYYLDGQYVSSMPTGYPNKDDEKDNIYYSLSKSYPSDIKIYNDVKLYRTRTVEKAKFLAYACIDKDLKGTLLSQTPCEERKTTTYKITSSTYYTCNGKDKVANKNVSCKTGQWSGWTENVCQSSDSIECEAKDGYKVTEKAWRWYKEGSTRLYYPSNSGNVDDENVYFVSAPSEELIKDEDSSARVFKFFKFEELKDEDTEGIEPIWFDTSENYESLSNLFKSFKTNGFEINSLKEIIDNDKIRYNVYINYRDRK